MANLSDENGKQKLLGCSQAILMSLSLILCILSVHIHDWFTPVSLVSCRGPPASRCSRCSPAPLRGGSTVLQNAALICS